MFKSGTNCRFFSLENSLFFLCSTSALVCPKAVTSFPSLESQLAGFSIKVQCQTGEKHMLINSLFSNNLIFYYSDTIDPS